jgi:hypothetical protein
MPELSEACEQIHHPVSHAILNLYACSCVIPAKADQTCRFLLLLVLGLSGVRIYDVSKCPPNTGKVYMGTFLGALYDTALVSLTLMANGFVISGTRCLSSVDKLGFGVFGGLFLVLSSVTMMVTHLVVYVRSCES